MTDIIESKAELSTEMTQDERERRDELIGVVNEFLRRSLEAWLAWGELRERRLYRETHKTWGQFCLDTFGLTKSQINNDIAAAGVIVNLKQGFDGVWIVPEDQEKNDNNCCQIPIPLPQNEAQARPLTAFSKPEQLQIWETVVEAAGPEGKITAALVEAAAKKHRGEQVKKKLEGIRKSREDQVSKQFDFGFNQFKNEIERALLSKFRDTSKPAILRYLDGLIEIRETISKM